MTKKQDKMQSEVIRFLLDADNHADECVVERIDTQLSVLFLIGQRVLKLKRAVHLDFVDFSSAERRRLACEAEIRINCKNSPGLYLRMLTVTIAPDGSLAIGGTGEPVEYLVEMVRFDQACLFDNLIECGEVTESLLIELVDRIGALHSNAEVVRNPGAGNRMVSLVEMEVTQFFASTRELFNSAQQDRLGKLLRVSVEALAELLERRGLDGFVRRCHGDLHLGNIVVFNGQPMPFDAIEFSDDLTIIDIWYDLAFLIMELLHKRSGKLAAMAINRYLEGATNDTGLRLMPLFLALRALVRCRVSAVIASSEKAIGRYEHAERQYLAAHDYYASALAAFDFDLSDLNQRVHFCYEKTGQ